MKIQESEDLPNAVKKLKSVQNQWKRGGSNGRRAYSNVKSILNCQNCHLSQFMLNRVNMSPPAKNEKNTNE